ncbi:L-lactate dehydrogenase (cytochrome) [Paraburkholderia sp. BL23I1N1]|uniref:alpha-hydroxy acid oxidase n=1 Tax=unclassified Paraburkholderia TaxID=2615204 RepID=UPI000E76B561|nr:MULTISPECIES: alpha-hydroxy acid oxidase [unclassified Paraburkholderia]RKE23858.1 L-lactate dehydrogenase (cytochrome) [Paraburkholderia sp. BL23I1N1]TDY15589.1 L-lactate dehydrogenase (cytochrome) [Paraburkholderia sp. BL6665CI2N2]
MKSTVKAINPHEAADAKALAKAAYEVRADLPKRLRRVLSLNDFENEARSLLPRPLFGYIAGAAEDSTSLTANRLAFARHEFCPKVMINVSRRSQSTDLFGHKYSCPFGIAPVGISAISAYRGDIVLASAAQKLNIPAIMSGSSLIRMEEVHDAAPATWFQAYLPGDSGRIDALIDRVESAKFSTLVITVDIPVWANRENNIRTGFSLPLRPSVRLAFDGITHPRWLFGTFLQTMLRHGMPHFENSFSTRGAPMLSASAVRDTTGRDHLCWDNIERIRRRWKGRLVLKGILHPDDAKRAALSGVDGIIVSNHGGRQLDGAVSPLTVLPLIKEAVQDSIVVMMDSGIRRGSDVLKALALGAAFVFLGRPFMYAAAVAGESGVRHAITLLRDEVDRNMAMVGATSVEDLTASILV